MTRRRAPTPTTAAPPKRRRTQLVNTNTQERNVQKERLVELERLVQTLQGEVAVLEGEVAELRAWASKADSLWEKWVHTALEEGMKYVSALANEAANKTKKDISDALEWSLKNKYEQIQRHIDSRPASLGPSPPKSASASAQLGKKKQTRRARRCRSKTCGCLQLGARVAHQFVTVLRHIPFQLKWHYTDQ
ncbi:hypothetical protein PHYPSEUDO_008428 [Phytophthora pseudosyringae]|uniref:Uncharacterized protein n=1 Tax=Phytophthora pseudosyringae TaxID=221518 RepID=A0A8T1WDL9_9STRA|nr:hypothetical protein PHYPSEUDO_008428 [Phytophthora pseudosyringae]